MRCTKTRWPGTELVLLPSGPRTTELLLASVLLFVSRAGGFEVDAEERRAEERDNDGRPDGPEDIRDGIRDRHGIEYGLGLIGRQVQAGDRVGREPHRRRDRLRPGVEPRCRAHVVACELGAEIRRQETEHADDGREQGLRHAVLRDAAHELRADAVADREQEHQEEEGLERARDVDPELPDNDGGDERCRHGAEPETLIREGPDVISDRERQKDRDLGILAKCVCEPIEHGSPHR
jgi:hypothetical protein